LDDAYPLGAENMGQGVRRFEDSGVAEVAHSYGKKQTTVARIFKRTYNKIYERRVMDII
jgi:hypothetical protein